MRRHRIALHDGVVGRIAQSEELAEAETPEIEFQAATDVAHCERSGEGEELACRWLGLAAGLRLWCAV
jgi:hypothetical protein